MNFLCYPSLKKRWYTITFILAIYGFFKELRPVDPFLTPYLEAPPKNISESDLDSKIYDVWTYSYLVALVPVCILTDLVRYKPVILFESIWYLVTWILLLWGNGVLTMQFMQGAYGLATATEIAYYSYIYAVIEPSLYQTATSYVRGSVVLGRTISAGISQLVVYLRPGDYMILNYISLASMFFIFFVALLLPDVGWNMADFNKTGTDADRIRENPAVQTESSQVNKKPTFCKYTKLYFHNLVTNFLECYSSTHVIKWSVWWAFATCGFFQVGNYVQNLWSVIKPLGTIYNGLTELVNNLLSTLLVFCFQFLHIKWEVYGELMIGIIMCVDAVLLTFMGHDGILLAYVSYVVYSSLYQLLITIATYNLAKKLQTQNYGLVLGFNMFLALVFQTILTTIVADAAGLALSIRAQFVVYGAYHYVISIIFFAMGAFGLGQYHQRNKNAEELHGYDMLKERLSVAV